MKKPMQRLLPAAGLAILLASLTGPVGGAHGAEPAAQFLKGLAGDYRGRGTAKLTLRSDEERVTCKLSNRYDGATKALVVDGDCASTQGKSAVNGKISHEGDTVSGSLISTGDGASVTKSTGSLKGGRLVVSTNFVDNTTGRLTRTLQVIRQTGGGFEAEFFVFENSSQKFEKTGSIRFSRS